MDFDRSILKKTLIYSNQNADIYRCQRDDGTSCILKVQRRADPSPEQTARFLHEFKSLERLKEYKSNQPGRKNDNAGNRGCG